MLIYKTLKIYLINIILTDSNGKIVAFHAILSKKLNNVPTNTIIKFGKVLVNEGSGYNAATGKFTAPFDGWICEWQLDNQNI